MLPESVIKAAVAAGLNEDAPWGDITSSVFLPRNSAASLSVRVKQSGVICGLPVAGAVFSTLDAAVAWGQLVEDGSPVSPGDIVASVRGEIQSLLQGERLALNFLQRLSGVATLTAAFSAEVRRVSSRCNITDTRKTTPGLRQLEKYAVRCGGGVNHRFGLSDGVLLKDNHLALLVREAVPLARAIQQARESLPHLYRIEVEVESPEQAHQALEAGADALLLDNMDNAAMAAVVAMSPAGIILEASGNMSLERVGSVAGTGVHLISVGALTHSAPALDISLDWDA